MSPPTVHRFLGFVLLLVADSVSAQAKAFDSLKFTSAFGSFTMDNPYGWTQIREEGKSSFVGKISLDNRDTLEFDYGFWVSLLSRDKLSLALYDTDSVHTIGTKKAKGKIDGYDAYISTPAPTATKFLLTGNNLSMKNQKLFFDVIKTLRFERQ